jgi:type II secretory pathway component HofQ
MKIRITKEVKERPKWKAGTVLHVSNQKGRELIKKKEAVEVGGEVLTQSEIDLRKHEIEQKSKK